MSIDHQKIRKTINATHRNGFVSFFKNILPKRSQSNDTYSTMYRKKTYEYYGDKLTKPFKLLEQPQYKRQLNFTSNFNIYMDSLQQYGKIRQKTPQMLQTMQKKIIKETFYNQLTIDPVIDRKRKISNSFSQYMQDKKQNKNNNLFPTYKTIQINNKNNKRDQSKQNVFAPPLKLQRKQSPLRNRISILDPSSTRRRKDSKQIINSSPIRANIQEQILLEKLNKLNETTSKKNNFRMQKSKLHTILQNRYQHEIFTIFFNMQNVQHFEGMHRIIKQLLLLQLKYCQLLTFLSYDINQDGLICQDDLMIIKRQLNINSILNDDIHLIIKYIKQKNIKACPVDLPQDFINYPSLREVKKIKQDSYSISNNNSGKLIERLFSTNAFQLQKIDNKQQQVNVLPKVNKNNKSNNKKISINFQVFQDIFGKNLPNFIPDLVYFLSEQQQPNKPLKNQDNSRTQSLATLDQKISLRQQIKAQKKLKQMRDYNKTFTIIKYQ